MSETYPMKLCLHCGGVLTEVLNSIDENYFLCANCGSRFPSIKKVSPYNTPPNMGKNEFVQELRSKIIRLRLESKSPIIDIIHHPELYYIVEEIIDFMIDYFIKEGE
jgi:hypothetical protein